VGTLRSDTKRQVADFVRNHYKPRPEAKFAKSTEERSDSPQCPYAVRVALRVLLNHVEPGWDNCKYLVEAWLDGKLDDGKKP
jgi:hypothetical protein